MTTTEATDLISLDELVSLCKRRGFIFQSSDIYGGVQSVYDYGPLGVELKNNLRDAWWRAMVREHEEIVGIDAGILMHPEVWVTSGHVATFSDPLIECQNCHRRFRADEFPELDEDSEGDASEAQCPVCGVKGQFTEPRQFNLMFKTYMGPVEDESAVTYLRPETAQGAYVNFKNVLDSSRVKVPFGIAQVGKAFRNEITPGNFIFRTREFEQMEMQYFVEPGTDEEWFETWRERRQAWLTGIGLRADRLRMHEHAPDKLAHYAKRAVDFEYRFPHGWHELEGVHNRTDFDLSRHQEASGKKMEYVDAPTNTRFVPYVIETAIGLNRLLLAVLADAYHEEEVEGESRTVLRLHPSLAPTSVAVFPLVKKDGMPEMAERITADLRRRFPVFYDESGSIGRRYRRQDEAGTPFCVTVDGESIEDGTVTVRDRDTLEQDRVSADALRTVLAERLAGPGA
ncbi:MAG TPA: glycine--tRNA ligase [Gemmatimonadota bacterium]|nr:glycine--tRNA ligase [Gemmatimonadota bacterium]